MYSIVITTVNIPYAVEELILNCIKYNHFNVFFVIVGDLKTPKSIKNYFAVLKKRYPDFLVYYVGPDFKEGINKKFLNFIPYNSVERRNFGYLFAASKGAEIIITADDDNYPLDDDDYIGGHSIVNTFINADSVKSSCGWFNICSHMKSNPEVSFYHRGFPLTKRWGENHDNFKKGRFKIGVNVGLWLGDADIDTFVRMAMPFKVESINKNHIVVCPGTQTVFNSQNTAFSVKYLPFFYLII